MEKIISGQWKNWYYECEGEGPWLILIHGFPQSGLLWKEVRRVLSASYRLMVVDLPGAGRSAYQAGLTMEGMAEDLGQILRQEGASQYWIAGHSMGGYLALAHASGYADGMVGLSLIHSSVQADTPEKVAQMEKSIALISKGGKAAFIKQMMPTLFAPRFVEAEPKWIEWLTQHAMEISDEALIAFYQAMIQRKDHRDWVQQTELPIQWIMGSEDRLAPPEAIWPQTTLASRTFVEVLKGCGHMSMIEDPRRLESALLSYGKYIFG